MKRLIQTISLLLLSSALHAQVMHIDNEKTAELLKQDIPIIDVRMEKEWIQTGIVEGSHLLTFFDEKGNYDTEKWKAELDKIAGKDKPFMLICAVGGRTMMLSQFLDKQAGYSKVHNVKGGIVSWISEGKDVVKYVKPEAAADKEKEINTDS